MSQPEIDRSSVRRILSALADGDATDSESQRAFQAWREDGAARADWHAYQLIGDVMRSDDLAASPAADARFLAGLRARLAAEPVILAPVASPVAPAPAAIPANASTTSWMRGRWQAPLAVAAGFIVMIGGVNVVRPFGSASHPGDASVASLGNAPVGASGAGAELVPAGLTSSGASSAPAGTGAAAGALTASAQKAETEQLAPYLAAHRQSTMNGVFQMPGGDLRNVSLVQTAP